tara:strand:- start:3400 stop:3639 length:240 start_codon:yes stop_codon:yes gene_type:complete
MVSKNITLCIILFFGILYILFENCKVKEPFIGEIMDDIESTINRNKNKTMRSVRQNFEKFSNKLTEGYRRIKKARRSLS